MENTNRINLKQLKIADISFKNDLKVGKETKLEIKINNTSKLSKDGLECKCDLTCDLNGKSDDKNSELKMKITVEGVFDSKEKLEKSELLQGHMLNVLFPYLSSYVTTITSLAGIPPIYLPGFNINMPEHDK